MRRSDKKSYHQRERRSDRVVPCHPIADGLPSETGSSPLAQGNPRQMLRCRELDGRTSAAKAFDRLVADIESKSRRLRSAERHRARLGGLCRGRRHLQHLNAQLAVASLSLDGLRDAPPFAAKAPPCVPGADPRLANAITLPKLIGTFGR